VISVKVKATKSPLKELAALPKNAQKAINAARKLAVKELQTLAVSETVGKYYLTKGQIRKTMRVIPEGFKVSSEHLSLDKYKLTPSAPRNRKSVLKGAVKREGGLKEIPGAFLMLVNGGKYKPAIRKGKPRLPVKVLLGPSTAQAVGNDETGEVLQERAAELFSERLNDAFLRLGIMK